MGRRGVEPPRLAAYAPEAYVSAISPPAQHFLIICQLVPYGAVAYAEFRQGAENLINKGDSKKQKLFLPKRI